MPEPDERSTRLIRLAAETWPYTIKLNALPSPDRSQFSEVWNGAGCGGRDGPPMQSDPEFQTLVAKMKSDLDDVRDDVIGVYQLICR